MSAWNDVATSLRQEEILGPCKDAKERKLFGELFEGTYIVPDPGMLQVFGMLESVLVYGAQLGSLAATNKELSDDKINESVRPAAHQNLINTAMEYAIEHDLVWEQGKEVNDTYKDGLINFMRLSIYAASLKKQVEKHQQKNKRG